MLINILWQVVSARHLYLLGLQQSKAKLCVFILGMWYLYLGVLKAVFRFGCVVCVLVTRKISEPIFLESPNDHRTASVLPVTLQLSSVARLT